MNWYSLILSLAAGALLGFLFFGGLWLTVQKISGSRSPYLVSVGSFLVRTAVVMGCFYLLLQAGWPHLLAALTGFIITRTILTYKLGSLERRDDADDNQPR